MDEFAIESIEAREILDCRLEPTLRVTVETAGGVCDRADVPVGRSTGANEAVERRDGGRRFDGRGVREAVGVVEETVSPALSGTDVRDQYGADERLLALDGTPEKSRLGGNVTTGVSLAVLRTAATALGVPLYRHLGGVDARRLPVPLLDMIEGGQLAATDLDFQEHHLVPVGFDSFSAAIRAGAEVYAELGDRLASEWGRDARNVGVEGGYTPVGMTDPRDAFDALLAAAEERGYGDAFALGIDAAATHFYDEDAGTYDFMGEPHTRGELIECYADLESTYPLVSIEDPLAETDFEGAAELTSRLDCQVVGDDLFVTDAARVDRGAAAGAANALLLKVNQAGTVTEALAAAETARREGYAVQVSERSGQTPDTWLADLAVGIDAGQIKTGVTRGERTEQYNRLLEIEADLGAAGRYEWTG